MVHLQSSQHARGALCTAVGRSACPSGRPQCSCVCNMQSDTQSLAVLPGAGSGDFLECAEDLGPRRSVDVRMADAATLPMAAFGAAGIETSSAVIRGLMASHDHWQEPERPAQAPG